MDANAPITLAVAAHDDPHRARGDFAAVWETRPSETSDHMAVAELSRDAAGSLRVIRHKSTTTNVAWGRALLGAALVYVVPVAGAGFLASVPSVGGAGAVVGHLHRTIPREERDLATGLLERHESGLVLLAVNRRPRDVEPLLGQADETFAMMSSWNGLDRAIEQEIAESQSNPSGT
ncbi:MAG TPA: hypothetical protein VNT92_02600 [Acidimicrobiia bacterium]|nr:hypothetical protein [Acidimicrobiia bacterium]